MSTTINAQELTGDLLKRLAARGIDQAEVVLAESRDFSVTVRLGEIETLEEASSRGLGLRIFKNGASALSHTSDFADKTVNQLLDDLLDMVEISDADPANGLPEPDLLGRFEGPIEVYDESLERLSAGEKIDAARRAEAAGLAHDPRLDNSDGASFSDSSGRFVLANSRGFYGERRGTNVSLSVSLAAQADGVKQTDYWYNSHRFYGRLEAPEAIGRRAGERTVKKLGARKVKTQRAPVVFDPLVARGLARMIFGAASAGAVFRQSSFLADKLGATIAAPLVTILDQPTLRTGVASRAFDGEGVRSAPLTLVENGVLKNFAGDCYSMRRLNLRSTGHAARGYSSGPGVGATNLSLVPGTSTPEAIIGSVKNGLYLTQLFGMGYNPVTGDLSQGAAGYWIENGVLSYPVQEITLAGNLLDLLLGIEAVGNDVTDLLGATSAPTILIGAATIGGS